MRSCCRRVAREGRCPSKAPQTFRSSVPPVALEPQPQPWFCPQPQPDPHPGWGLPIVEAAAVEGLRSKHGKMFDRYGDVASNDGDGGHQTRHYKLNLRIADVLRSVWGSAVQREPEDHASYSDYRPDLVALGCGRSTPNTLRIIETKLLSSIPSDPSMMSDRGRTVGFANTLLEVNEQVRGLQERGSPKDGQWRYATGTGYVKAKSGDYTRLHYAAAFEISMALRVPKFAQGGLDAAAARRMAGGC